MKMGTGDVKTDVLELLKHRVISEISIKLMIFKVFPGRNKLRISLICHAYFM